MNFEKYDTFPLRGNDWTFMWDINRKGYIQPEQIKESLRAFHPHPQKNLIMKILSKQQSWKNFVMNTYVPAALIQPFLLYYACFIILSIPLASLIHFIFWCFFFSFGRYARLVGSQFPNQGLNPGHCSAESWPLDHQGTPVHAFFKIIDNSTLPPKYFLPIIN